VDATDRDHPKVLKSTELSWSADRVHLAGDYLIEIDASGSGSPALHVVSAEDSASLLQTFVLTNIPYMGSAKVGNKLYVLQGKPVEVLYPKIYNPTNYNPIGTNPGVFLLSEFDLGTLPALSPSRQAAKVGSTNYFYGQYEAIPVSSNLLVWRSKSSGYFPWGPIAMAGVGGGIAIDTMVARPAPAVDFRFRPWWGGGGAGHFIAFDTDALSFASEVTLPSANGWWNLGEAFTTNGLLFTSHQASEYDETIDPPPFETQCYDSTLGQWVTCTNDPPPGLWVQRYYLDVLDFSDPADPLVRKPVNIPGSLIGLSRGGELLYTRGYEVSPMRFYYASEETISASSFDGVQAHLLSSMTLSNEWPRPSLANGSYLYLGVPPTKEETNATLQVWIVNEAGKFERIQSQPLDSPAQQLEIVQDLLAVQSNEILLFDVAHPAEPALAGRGRSNTCYGVLLDAADGEAARGLWVPVGWYGVLQIPAKKSPQD